MLVVFSSTLPVSFRYSSNLTVFVTIVQLFNTNIFVLFNKYIFFADVLAIDVLRITIAIHQWMQQYNNPVMIRMVTTTTQLIASFTTTGITYSQCWDVQWLFVVNLQPEDNAIIHKSAITLIKLIAVETNNNNIYSFIC